MERKDSVWTLDTQHSLRLHGQEFGGMQWGWSWHHCLHCTLLHCNVLYCTVRHGTVLHYTVLHCTLLYFTLLAGTVLRNTKIRSVHYLNYYSVNFTVACLAVCVSSTLLHYMANFIASISWTITVTLIGLLLFKCYIVKVLLTIEVSR